MSSTLEAPVEAPRHEDLPIPEHLKSAWSVLIAGLRLSPELRKGLGLTVAVSLGAVVGNLVVPILVQQIFDHGFRGGFRPTFVFGLCGAAFALVLVAFLAGRAAARRLVRASEEALMALRVRGFEHIHRLSIATQSRERRGVFVARVTADVDTLSQFTEEGGIAWIWAVVQISLTLVIMLFYSWQLTIPVVLLVVPLLLVMGKLQAKMSEAYDLVRGRVGEMLSEVSESVMGADVVRAYGLEGRVDARVKRSIRDRYRAHVLAHLRTARLWPMGTIFWGLALSTVVFVGVMFGPEWDSRSARCPRSCSSPTCSCIRSPTYPRSTPRPRRRSRAGERSSRCSSCPWRSRSPHRGWRSARARSRCKPTVSRTGTPTARSC